MSDEITLRLDRDVARDLWGLLYALGEQIAAGAPVFLPPPRGTIDGLGTVYRDLEQQLGINDMRSYQEAMEIRKRKAAFLRGTPNLRGRLTAPPSLSPVNQSLGRRGEYSGRWVSLLGAAPRGGPSIRVEGDDIDVSTEPLEGAEHAISGEIGGDPAHARATFERLAAALSASGAAFWLDLDLPDGVVHADHTSARQADQKEAEWQVWRQDDAGNKFLVRGRLTEGGARALAHQYEAKGHKQMYWAAPAE